jgi:hypothetical protein
MASSSSTQKTVRVKESQPWISYLPKGVCVFSNRRPKEVTIITPNTWCELQRAEARKLAKYILEITE